MKKIPFINAVSKLALLSAVGLLVACSSGDNDPVGASISGTIFAAAVNGAQVSVIDGSGNEVAAPVPTNDDGEYTLTIPHGSLNQGLYIKSIGGSFTDEATGLNGNAGEMLAFVAAIKNGDSVSVTPGSTIIATLIAKGGKTLAEAQTAFADAFGYAPDASIVPLNATVAPVDGASEEAKLAGLRAATFSQLAMDLGLSQNDQFDLFDALAKDLSDGELNGVDASDVVVTVGAVTLKADIHSSFSQALTGFRASGNNQSGLTPNKIGHVPFAKVAMTNRYKIEYLPGAMDAQTGKTEFKLRITKNSDESAATGLTPGMMPMMNMEAHSHSSAKGSCIEDGSTGIYDCTMYYVMGSVMGSGDSMGYWMLTVKPVMDESAKFYPLVKHMAMGGTSLVKLKGQSGDMVPGMTTSEMQRTYLLFKDGFSGMGNDRIFNLYIATRENMMSYPAVFAGATLNECAVDSDKCKTAHQLNANTMTVEVSTDASAWVGATDVGNTGHWTATGLTGLVDDAEGKIYVRLTINDEVKTTNGKDEEVVTVDGTPILDSNGNEIPNKYATFTITPGGM